MKKYFILTACITAIVLYYVGQSHLSLNSYVISNIEALSNAENGASQVTIESVRVYDASDVFLKWGSNPVQGTPWSYYDHSVWDKILALYFGGYSGEEYWCTEATTNNPTLMECYEIVVRPN